MYERTETTPSRRRAARWLVAFAIFANVAFNYVSERMLPGDSTRVISDRYATFFTPAHYTFSIWGLIYGAFIAYAIAGLLPSQRHVTVYDGLAYPLTAVNVLATIWILLFRAEALGLSLLVIIAMLALAIAMFRTAHRAVSDERASRWLSVPFGLFFGWLTVATLANFQSYVVYSGNHVSALLSPAGAVVFMILATIASAFIAFLTRDIAFPAIVGWALVGIAVAQRSVDGLASFALFCAALCLALSAYSAQAQRKRRGGRKSSRSRRSLESHRRQLESFS